ncbi:MAG: alpha/beta hydrolase [Hyphomonadaceae bacterium]
MINNAPEYLDHQGARIAFRRTQGDSTGSGIVWMGGFHSDMLGEKATSLHESAVWAGRSFIRFDYFGHGESSGQFEDGTIGRWRSDALAVVDQRTEGSLVVVGSSMGGWMALLAALARPERIKGLVLLAPAPDFTDKLMWASFDDSQKRQIIEDGFWTRPSPYDASGYRITRELIEEGREWNILDGEIAVDVPVRILHGGLDADVPWTHSLDLADKLRSKNVVWSLIKDGDHRLSRPQDIARMTTTVLETVDQVDASSRCRQSARPSR